MNAVIEPRSNVRMKLAKPVKTNGELQPGSADRKLLVNGYRLGLLLFVGIQLL